MAERSHQLFEETVAQRYVLYDHLGDGPIGSVYRARDETTGQIVSLKLGMPRLSVSTRFVETWRETAARTAGPLRNTAEVLDWGVCPEMLRPFIVARYVAGQSLAELMNGQVFSAADAGPVLEQIARSLHAAHQTGLGHGDLKPANVILADEGEDGEQVFVRDYEMTLALERAVEIHAPLDFRAPELIGTSRAVTPQSDLYSLGRIALRLLTGNDPRTLDREGPLTPLLYRLLQERPENRPRNAGDVAAWISALGGYLGGGEGPDVPRGDEDGMQDTLGLGIPAVPKPSGKAKKPKKKPSAAMFGEKRGGGVAQQADLAKVWMHGEISGLGDGSELEEEGELVDSADIESLGSVDFHPADAGQDAGIAPTMALQASPELMAQLRALGPPPPTPPGELSPEDETGELQVPEHLLLAAQQQLQQGDLMEPTMALQLPPGHLHSLEVEAALAEAAATPPPGKHPTGRQPKWMPTAESPGVAKKRATMQMEAPDLDAPASAGPSRRTWLIAGGVTAVAIAGGLLAFFLR